MLQVKPITVVINNSKITLSLKCIPKDYLDSYDMKYLKNLCNDFDQESISRSKVYQGSMREKGLIIFNHNHDISDENILPMLMEYIKINLKILDQGLKFLNDNLIIFNLYELETPEYMINEIKKSIIQELMLNCTELINEQFMFRFEKRCAKMLVRNYLEYRYNPKYGYCKYILNKQYDEMVAERDNLNSPVKRVKLN